VLLLGSRDCRVVSMLQSYITLTLFNSQSIARGIEVVVRALAMLGQANDRRWEGLDSGERQWCTNVTIPRLLHFSASVCLPTSGD